MVAVEEPWPVATRDLYEVSNGVCQVASTLLMARHCSEQARETSSDFAAIGFRWVLQNLCRFVYPPESDLHTRPQRCGLIQSTIDESLQSVKLFRQPLFSATRSILSETNVNLRRTFNPDASRGGRPSSVIELRTAAQ